MKLLSATEMNLTEGSILKTMLLFSVPMILGNLLQQVYNLADTMIVGHYLGAAALAAVGSAYALMTFLTSVIMGLCMGSSAVFSIAYGAGDERTLKESILVSFWFILLVSVALNIAVFVYIEPILGWLQIPDDVYPLMYDYVRVIFAGILFTFVYNYFACLLRAVGNSLTPLLFLAIASVLNIVLDIWFVAGLEWGVAGAAWATVIAQAVSGLGLAGYTAARMPSLRIQKAYRRMDGGVLGRVISYSFITCAQQSVMNFGILMIQGLVNSFGTVIMAAFAVTVKIDTLAYMPAQEFGNAFSLFLSQNFGAKKFDRIKKGVQQAFAISIVFGGAVSALVWLWAEPMIAIFLEEPNREIISAGINYLHIEGAFYFGIGSLFLFYGLYRAINKPMMSFVLTVISLGTRVVLAYTFAPYPGFGVDAIWWAIVIGWILADIVGWGYYMRIRSREFVGARSRE